MIKKLIAILIMMIVLIGVSGCTSEKTQIKNEEQASQAVIGASESIQEISSTLNDVDNTLS